MKLMLHISDAASAAVCVKRLRDQGVEPVGYWYNPNIHPFTEYCARRDDLKRYAESIGLELIVEDEYDLRNFVRAVAKDIDGSEEYCNAVRLGRAIQYASRHGFDAYATTLTAFPGADATAILAMGTELAQALKFKFEPYDFSDLADPDWTEARALGLYIPKYSGSIFSEEDAYRDQLPKPGKIYF